MFIKIEQLHICSSSATLLLSIDKGNPNNFAKPPGNFERPPPSPPLSSVHKYSRGSQLPQIENRHIAAVAFGPSQMYKKPLFKHILSHFFCI